MDNFTRQATSTIIMAEHASSPRGPNPVAPEHILLGLLHVDPQLFLVLLPNNPKVVARLRLALKPFVYRFRRSWVSNTTPSLSNAAREVIELAVKLSNEFGHDYVGTEHLLLGLLNCEHKSEPSRLFGLIRSKPVSIKKTLNEYGYNAEEVAAQIKNGSVTSQDFPAGSNRILVQQLPGSTREYTLFGWLLLRLRSKLKRTRI